ncbi:MAG: tryptophan 2,3-dioxygenase family protein [Flavobacteriales bacterium]|nr:tryptophan 2,3-dioxygenase family protein [Flavobacteriales bacterium]
MPSANEFDPAILAKLEALEAKYAAMGQDLSAYLDGLLHADFLTYWDYINLDTLLSLQHPITPFPDESIFIIYHQITELYFKLVLHELEQLSEEAPTTSGPFLEHIRRANRYFEALTHSFEIMVDGMDREQFLKFRMSLLPASGFQSAQYRMIEIRSTSFDRLLHPDHRENHVDHSPGDLEDLFEKIYWKAGAVELATGKKTLTLNQFEVKYSGQLLELAENSHGVNTRALWGNLPLHEQTDELRQALRWLDVNVNVNWPLSHYKSAVRYLQRDPEDIAATGGTNWQKYLPPRFQKRIFYPELWSAEELDEWGKAWVKREVFGMT